jgi:hypothetical protein
LSILDPADAPGGQLEPSTAKRREHGADIEGDSTDG